MAEDIIKEGEVVEQPMEPVVENTVQFKLLSDRTVLHILSEKNNEVMIEISGYDLQINFNFEYLKSIQDIEAACDGVSQLFREIITEKLLEHKQNK